MRPTRGFFAAILAVLCSGAALSATSAFGSPVNVPPPAGAIIDLGGTETGTAAQAINHGTAVTESVSFTAGLAYTDITFAFRDDPDFLSFSDVSLTDTSTGSLTNLILNGNFSQGSGQNPLDWTFVNVYGAVASGNVYTACGGGLATCWYDGSIQSYDAIDQVVATTVGQTYLLSFEYSEDSNTATFADVSTNGDTTDTNGNGVDILGYAQAGLPPPAGSPPPVPEPSSIVLAVTGLLGVVGARRRRSQR